LHDAAPRDEMAVQLAQRRLDIDVADGDEPARPRIDERIYEQLQLVLEEPAAALEGGACRGAHSAARVVTRHVKPSLTMFSELLRLANFQSSCRRGESCPS
jgi:hypothetical protein